MNLKVQKLNKQYKNSSSTKVINDLSFELEEGKILGIAGESECGKSTLARILLRLMDPSSGQVLINDNDIFKYSKTELKEFRTCSRMIFQSPDVVLNPGMTIEQILTEALNVREKHSHDKLKKELKKSLDTVKLPNSILKKYPREISGGEKKRVSIARAFGTKPEFIIADEPFSALDASSRGFICQLFQNLKKQNDALTMIIISHDNSILKLLCDKIEIMVNGKFI
jgi:ABC-type glutathione transport system ATPase component